MPTNEQLADPAFMQLYRQMLAKQNWQNQLASGLGIANAGWKTALGLNLGTLLGGWLGHKFGNWQRMQNEDYTNPPDARTPQGAYANLFNQSDFDLGWQPSPYWNSADYSWQASPQIYNQDWRQNMVNRALPIPQWQPNLTQATTRHIAPVAQTPAQTTTSNTTTPRANPPPQNNFTWGYRPLTEGTLKSKPAMSIAEAMDNVLPYYGLSRW